MLVPCMLNGSLLGTNVSAVQLSLRPGAASRPVGELDRGTVFMAGALQALHGVSSAAGGG